MNSQSPTHLDYDDLLKAVVDVEDLPPDQRGHLNQCPQCQRAMQRLEKRYLHLGRMARKMAPEPSAAFRVPQDTRPAARWQFKPALAIGLAGALIFFFSVWWPQRFETKLPDPQMTTAAMDEELELMLEVDALVEDALPSALQQLVAVSDSNTSQDLIEWVLPSIDDEEDLDPQAEMLYGDTKSGLLAQNFLHFRQRGYIC